MALETLSVRMIIDEIHCFDEGDGWGSAEPYLWTVFFKVDGSTVQVTDSLTLSGVATVYTTPGSHGNLGDTDVDEGDTIAVPSAIGEWSTTLRSIPVPEWLEGLVPDGVAGLVGVVCVFMEEDNVTDAGAEAGHAALNASVEQALNAIVATRSVTNPSVSDAEIEEFTQGIDAAVSDAVAAQQNIFENIWSWLNPDDQIGNKVFMFTHDSLEADMSQSFSHRWRNEGDWELRGRVMASELCTIDLSDVFARALGFEIDRDAMWGFRAEELPDRAVVGDWIDLVRRNNAVLRDAMQRDEAIQLQAIQLARSAQGLLEDRDEPLSDEFVASAAAVLEPLRSGYGRRARVDANRLIHVLEEYRGETPNTIIAELSTFRPGRRPSIIGTGLTETERVRRLPSRVPRVH